jgi:hypothetical protein
MIKKSLQIPIRTARNIVKKAEERGFDRRTTIRVKDKHVINTPRPGRSVEVIEVMEKDVINLVNKDRLGREKLL